MKSPCKEFHGTVVMPGDVVTSRVAELVNQSDRIKLGPGLKQDADDVVVSKSGILRHKQPGLFWVEGHQKRYIPVKGENVLGVVMGKAGEAYKIDIGCSDYVMLSNLAFEGATKRNRPNLTNGDLVYGKLVTVNKDMEPEMTCIDQSTGKANGMGPVPAGGFVMTVSLNLIRKILSPKCVLLPELGRYFGFETIIGMNGKIYITSHNENHVIAIMNMITSAEYLTNQQIQALLSETEANFR